MFKITCLNSNKKRPLEKLALVSATSTSMTDTSKDFIVERPCAFNIRYNSAKKIKTETKKSQHNGFDRFGQQDQRDAPRLRRKTRPSR